jgi:hypothetical protein
MGYVVKEQDDRACASCLGIKYLWGELSMEQVLL